MVTYNESWLPFSVTNLGDVGPAAEGAGPFLAAARGADFCSVPDWTACPDTGPAFTLGARNGDPRRFQGLERSRS
jgi:hypothetical protein